MSGQEREAQRVLASVQEVLERDDPNGRDIALAGVKQVRAALAARGEPRGEEPANERCYSVSEGKRCGRERHHPGIHTYFFDDGREASWIDNNLLGPSAREELPEGFRDEDIEALRRTQERYRTSREEGDYAAREDTERTDERLPGGDIYIKRGPEHEAFSLATSEAAEKFDERDEEMSWVWMSAKLFFARPAVLDTEQEHEHG